MKYKKLQNIIKNREKQYTSTVSAIKICLWKCIIGSFDRGPISKKMHN